jgi:hypothetical protein
LVEAEASLQGKANIHVGMLPAKIQADHAVSTQSPDLLR